jgi:Uncharacterized conserved protein (DUF2285)
VRCDAAPVACGLLLTQQRRHRFSLALRALHGRLAGESYRVIAAGPFGYTRIPADPGWKSHDLRDRTFRLVRVALELMQGAISTSCDNRAACRGGENAPPYLHHPPSLRCSAILAFNLPPLSGGCLQDHGVR